MYEDKKEILDFLKKDILKNINMVYFAEKNGIINAEKFGNTVVMRGYSDRVWTFISSSDEAELQDAVKKLTADDLNFAVIEDWMKPIILQNRKLIWDFETIRLYLPDSADLSISNTDEIISLSPEDAEYIYLNSHFNEYTPISYIEACIGNGTSAGIYKDGQLVAWAITHDDTAIGFLHVIDDYRQQGFAEKIMKYMINKTREQGRVPFVHIEESNFPSMNLALKLGLIQDKKVHWFEIE
jgi:8-oxo-dGTP diphosphatase